MKKTKLVFIWCWVWLVMSANCAESFYPPVTLRLEFAKQKLSELGAYGLPLDIQSYQIEAFAGSDSQLILGSTGCVLVSGPDSRISAFFDLAPHQNVTLEVVAFANRDCSGSPDWKGMAFGVRVIDSKETQVSIYVTRRGFRLNPTRSRFENPRAFATASELPDGRVLLSGGFDRVAEQLGEWELLASCDAVIYDPRTASLGAPILLAGECRGLHRTLQLADGKILLLGGSKKAIIRFENEIVLRTGFEDVVSTAELFDPDTESFSLVGPAPLLGRSGTAVAFGTDRRIGLLGGRTSELRSADIVTGFFAEGLGWSWDLQSNSLASARNGCQSLGLAQGILVVGGNGSGTQAMELVDPASWQSNPLSLQNQEEFSVTGHSLNGLDGNSALLVGGVMDFPGANPLANYWEIVMTEADPVIQGGALNHARAYHATARLPSNRFLVAGGIGEGFLARKDLEIIQSGMSPQLLADQLDTGSLGLSVATLPDGSILLAGGLDIQDGSALLSSQLELLSP